MTNDIWLSPYRKKQRENTVDTVDTVDAPGGHRAHVAERRSFSALRAHVADIHKPIGQSRRVITLTRLQLKEDANRQVDSRKDEPINSCMLFTTQLENHRARVTANSALFNRPARYVHERVDAGEIRLRHNW